MTIYNMHKSSTTLARYVYEQLRDDILNNKYCLGDKLSETVLSQRFNVSRTPIREALKILSMDGLVEDVPNKGCFVKGLTCRDIEDLFQIRIALERIIIPWAIERISKDQIDKMADICELMEFYSAKEDIDKLIELDNRFHGIIYNSVKSPLLESVVKAYQLLVIESRGASLGRNNRISISLNEHRQILEAFVNRDVENAVKFSLEHCIHILENVKKEFEE